MELNAQLSCTTCDRSRLLAWGICGGAASSERYETEHDWDEMPATEPSGHDVHPSGQPAKRCTTGMLDPLSCRQLHSRFGCVPPACCSTASGGPMDSPITNAGNQRDWRDYRCHWCLNRNRSRGGHLIHHLPGRGQIPGRGQSWSHLCQAAARGSPVPRLGGMTPHRGAGNLGVTGGRAGSRLPGS